MRKTLIILFFIFPSLTFASTYGSNFLSGVSCTDTAHYSTFGCANAIDGNLSTEYYQNGLPQDIIFDLGVGVSKKIAQIGSVRQAGTGSDTGHNAGKSISIYGSNDNSNWTFIATTTFTDGLNNSTWDYQNFTPVSTAYRYYKYHLIDSYYVTNPIADYFELSGQECTDCSGAGNTTSSIIGFMSPQLDFLLQLLVEAIFVIFGLLAGYLLIKKLDKK